MKIHPNDEVLEELLLSVGGRLEAVVRHIGGCAYCRAKLAYLPREAASGAAGEAGSGGAVDYGPAFERVWQGAAARERALARERADAPALLVELLERPAGEREALLAGSPRFHIWGLLELLAERSLEAAATDPAHGEELGLLALRLSQALDSAAYGAERLEDLRARAWAHVANACRIRSDLQGAEEAFGRAAEHLEKGTGDVLERAVLLDLEASLRRDQRRFEDAFRLLNRAVGIFRKTGERHRAGRSLVNLATVHYDAGDPLASIPRLHEALGLIDPEREPRLLLCAHHNLIFYLVDLGRFQEAQGLYRETRPLYRGFPDAWTQNRRRWVKGKIANGLGQLRQAESLFLAARDGFLAEGVPYDTALVSLELALLYSEQGRAEELKRLAAEMMPVFASRHIHREALAALAFLTQAIEAERAGIEMVTRVADYLRRARHDDGLRFEEGAR